MLELSELNAMLNVNSIIPNENLKIAICHKNDVRRLFFRNETDMKINSRTIEKRGVQELLKHFFISKPVKYSEVGAPFIDQSNFHFSISHSKELIALARCNYQIGIDTEEITKRASKIKSRFLNNYEMDVFGDTDENATLAWTIKEALYKICGQSKVIFKEDLKIINEIEKRKSYLCEFPWKGSRTKVICKSIQLNNHILTYNEAF